MDPWLVLVDPWLALVVRLVLITQMIIGMANANVFFNVQHKFGGRGGGRSILASLKAHNAQRHGINRKLLSAVEFQLGGDGLISGTNMYLTKLSIGTPPKDFLLQVDTGSDTLWINCAGCATCPKKTGLGFQLTQYDLKSSSTGKTMSCNDKFCPNVYNEKKPNCKKGSACAFLITYGSGDDVSGYYVRDSFNFDKISGDLQTSPINGGDIDFGCSTKRGGTPPDPSSTVDGIVGFAPGNSSILSQLALSGKTKKIFSHCLDSVEGGGLFAIGEVVDPKFQKTPMIPKQSSYQAYLQGIQVGGSSVWNVTGAVGRNKPKGTSAIFDSGSTLAYLQEEQLKPIMSKIMEKHKGLKTYSNGKFTCFKYNNNIDADFPAVSFHFENSAPLFSYPHDYLFSLTKGQYCFGLMNAPKLIDDNKTILLGDIVLSDKLVVYDLEKMTIGWTEYNCSSSIKVKDESTGKVYSVKAHDITPKSHS